MYLERSHGLSREYNLVLQKLSSRRVEHLGSRPPHPHDRMIRSQLRQIAQHGDRAWMGMAMPIRHFSAAHTAAAEGQSSPSGMRYTSLPLISAFQLSYSANGMIEEGLYI